MKSIKEPCRWPSTKINTCHTEVPSAKEMEGKGIDVGEMNMLLLKKVEELTLYVIRQNEKLEEVIKENQRQGENDRPIKIIET
jgi:hypothetical protein